MSVEDGPLGAQLRTSTEFCEGRRNNEETEKVTKFSSVPEKKSHHYSGTRKGGVHQKKGTGERGRIHSQKKAIRAPAQRVLL